MKKNILIITDSDYWAYNNIADNLIKNNSSNNLNIEKIHMRKNQKQVFDKILSKEYDLIFPMAYQIFSNENNIFKKIFKNKFFKFNNIDYSSCITGVHSSHSYDNYKSTPDNLLGPNKDLVQFLNNFKAINTVGLRLKNLFEKKLDKKVFYTPNGVDESQFYPTQLPQNKKFTLGFVGHIKRDENLGYSKFIKQIAKENFLEIKTAIYGTETYLTTDKLNNYYNSLDALIITSRSEGFPLRALEAMSCGTPVISTKVSGCEDLIIEGQNGFFIDYNLEAMIKKLKHLHNENLINFEIRKKTRESIIKNWTWKKVSNSWFNFFNQNL